jgi:hypothetical protein
MPPAFALVSYLVYSSALKIEATCFFQMSVDFERTARRYIPEYRTLYKHLEFGTELAINR